jgi:adrenodoxin-NADP+ reductase
MIASRVLSTVGTFNAVQRGFTASAHPRTALAVVGSGPAGFYFTDRVCRLLKSDIRIDILDKLPTPYGLVRSGVAPDHPDTKNVINKFNSIANQPNVRFFGNVEVGTDVSVRELLNIYSGVVLAYGAEEDRLLGIKGESSNGVLSARQFVNWYNAHPDYTSIPVDLSKTQSVGIVGLGNVALDCARILLRPVEDLEFTDIAEHALAQLSKSAIQSVHIIGRRGPFQAQFSGKELREILNFPNLSINVQPEEYIPSDADKKESRRAQKVRTSHTLHLSLP